MYGVLVFFFCHLLPMQNSTQQPTIILLLMSNLCDWMTIISFVRICTGNENTGNIKLWGGYSMKIFYMQAFIFTIWTHYLVTTYT